MQIILTPQELIEFLDGPQYNENLDSLAGDVERQKHQIEDIKKSLEILLKGGKK